MIIGNQFLDGITQSVRIENAYLKGFVKSPFVVSADASPAKLCEAWGLARYIESTGSDCPAQLNYTPKLFSGAKPGQSRRASKRHYTKTFYQESVRENLSIHPASPRAMPGTQGERSGFITAILKGLLMRTPWGVLS